MEIIKEQLKKIIKNTEPNVFSLRGSWGVGKSFLWNNFIKDNKDDLVNNNYSYVSLFGINSLEELKRAIFENMIKRESIGKLPDLSSFSENTKDFFDKISNKEERKNTIFNAGHKASKFIDKIPFLQNFSASFDAISFMYVNNILICLDDIERRGKDLDIKEIFGLCNYLKEQKCCKILIILNDAKENLSDYKEYREKIIDEDLLLNPSPKECNKIVFEGKYKNLQNNCELLNITNIRILKKIKKMYEELLSINKNLHKRIKEQIENSLPLFMYCFYSGNDDIPDLDYIMTNSFSSKIPEDLPEEEKKKFERWNNFIHSGNYISTDKFDHVLARFVSQGYVDEDKFKHIVANVSKIIAFEENNTAYHNAINKFKNSLDGEPSDLIKTITKTFKENIKNTQRGDLDYVVRLLRECNDTKTINELIDRWINEHNKHYECFDLSENYIYHEVQDAELIEKFNEIFLKLYKEQEQSQERIFEKIKNQEGLENTDFYILSNIEEDQLIPFIKSLNKNEMRYFLNIINTCKTFPNFKQIIYENSMKAFKKIASENKLNLIRLKYWGIEID